MSELKAYNVVATADVNPDVVDNLGCTEWPAYDKEDADKVIAEKDNELRHHKFKRCLAMAYVEWLKQMSLCYNPESILYRRAYRRERKWKEMAKKFKDAK